MIKLEDLQPNATLRGILPDDLVTVVNVPWYGSGAAEIRFKNMTQIICPPPCSLG